MNACWDLLGTALNHSMTFEVLLHRFAFVTLIISLFMLDEKCLTQNVVYQATASTQSSSETYVGLATNFKERYRNHTASFRHQSKRNDTELSKHIWALKDNNKPFDIKWRIIKQCRPYSNVSNKCNLCLFEKFIIICRKNLCSLNKRNELASSCPHRNRYLLKNIL